MIEVRDLTKRYGTHTAIDEISFTINKGEVIGFLGPNGAGKTTTMNIITGYIAPTKGEVKIDGIDITEEPERAKKNIGYLPDTPPVYGDMRVMEYFNFVADIKKVKKGRREMLEKIMEEVNIAGMGKRLIKNLSRGYRQRVGLAQAMIGWPQLIIMDEPTIGLDPKQIIEMREVIKRLGKKHTVILSSHIMQEVSAVCDRVLIINRGQIVASGTPQGLSDSLRAAGGMQVVVRGRSTRAHEALSNCPQIAKIESKKGRESGTTELLVHAEGGADIREAIFRCMAENNLPILLMKPNELTLEEIFLSITAGDGVYLGLEGGLITEQSEDKSPMEDGISEERGSLEHHEVPEDAEDTDTLEEQIGANPQEQGKEDDSNDSDI